MRMLLAGLIVAVVFPAPAQAQGPVAELGQRVRVVAAGDNPTMLAGTLNRVTASDLTLVVDGQHQVVDRRSLIQIDVSRGTHGHAGIGFLVGVGAGLAIATATWFAFPVAQPEGLLMLGILTVVPSGLVGAGIGALIRSDEQWQPAELPSPR